MTDHRHDPTLDPGRTTVKGEQHVRPVSALSLASVIVDVARDLARSVPAPRGAPYFYLDGNAGYDLSVLESFFARGIFRKYEFALDVGGGLGGRARWLAARSGCRILGVDARPSTVAAAALLNRRAHMDHQVAFQVGQIDCLPLRPQVFTHVWMVDPPERARSLATCREAFRVLRPGGHFAMHGALASAECDAWIAVLNVAGFIDLQLRSVDCAELPPAYRLARERLRIRLEGAEQDPPPLSSTAAQIFATRPA